MLQLNSLTSLILNSNVFNSIISFQKRTKHPIDPFYMIYPINVCRGNYLYLLVRYRNIKKQRGRETTCAHERGIFCWASGLQCAARGHLVSLIGPRNGPKLFECVTNLIPIMYCRVIEI